MASVVVVDDEPDIGLLVESVLARAGHCVRVATSRASALALVASSVPDIVLCDRNLDGDDGVELLAWFREHHPAVRGVLMSGFVPSPDLPPAMRVLPKPFTLTALLDLVDDLAEEGS